MPHSRESRRRAVAVVVLLALFAVLVAPAMVAAAGPRVVIVVGPVGRLNAAYREDAAEIAAEARRYTANVVVIRSPRATWQRVRDAAQGASIFVFLGHGNGHPSPYGAFHGDTKDGMGLDPARGGDGTRHVNYGEDYIRRAIRFAPNAAVLLYRLCYASGNTEPGRSEGSTWQSRQRVDNYGAGFLAAGARIVLATGKPKVPANYVRQLFRTDRSMLEVFRAAPDFHRHQLGPYGSRRTPGMRYVLDPDRGGIDPSGFYRSAVGDLALRTTAVTMRTPPPTPTPVPNPTPTPDPGGTPTPPPDATPTAPATEPAPDPTPTPAASSEPSGTPEPTASPGPTASPDPTGSPEPTASPDPTAAPGSPQDPGPTASPDPPG